MEFAHRLEEEKHWAPIWREIVEEEQNAGTFDAWDLDDEQVTCAFLRSSTPLPKNKAQKQTLLQHMVICQAK